MLIVTMFLELLIAFVNLDLLEMEQIVLVSLKPIADKSYFIANKNMEDMIVSFLRIFYKIVFFKIYLDINECNETPCHSNANCENVPGTFNCICRSGFTGNGTICVGKFETKTDKSYFTANKIWKTL